MRDPNWAGQDKFQTNIASSKEKLLVATIATGRSGKQKLVHYDASTLLRLGPLLTLLCKGTVLTLGSDFYSGLIQYMVVCGGCAAVLIFLEPELNEESVLDIIASVEEIKQSLQKLTPFIFGLFLALSVNRWWDMRMKSLGFLMDSLIANVNYLSNWVCRHAKSPEELAMLEQDIAKIVKYGVASVQCVALQARGEERLDSLVSDSLLTQEEADVMCKYKNRAVGLWVWIETLGSHILDKVDMPPPNLAPFNAECSAAITAVTRLLAYSETALPLPYVHMIVYLVFLNNLAMSAWIGLRIGQAVNMESWIAVAMCCIHQCLIPPIFHALTQICFLVEDPLGDDIIDFPIASFQSRVYDECKATMLGSHQYWALRTESKKRRAAARAAGADPELSAAPSVPAAAQPAAASPAKTGVDEEISTALQGEVARRMSDIMRSLNATSSRFQDLAARQDKNEDGYWI